MASPERRYAAVAISGEGLASTAPTFALVVALLTLGCRPLPTCPLVETVEEVNGALERKHVWMFKDRSEDRRYETDKLRKWWVDDEWLQANAEHPLAMLRARSILGACSPAPLFSEAARIECWLREELKKSVPLQIVRKGERRVLIPIDATPEEEAALLAKLDR